MGLFSAIGSLLGGGAAKKSIKKATKAQVDALNRAIDIGNQQFETTRQDFAPARAVLGPAVGGLGDLVGINGGPAQQAAIDALKASPFYQSLFRTGEETLLQNASATGGLRGGNTERGLADFGADTLMQTIQQQLASLGGLAGIGLGATGSVANFGANNAANAAGLTTSIGNAQASGALARGGINSQMWSNAGGLLDSIVGSIFGGMGGFGGLGGGGGMASAFGAGGKAGF